MKLIQPTEKELRDNWRFENSEDLMLGDCKSSGDYTFYRSRKLFIQTGKFSGDMAFKHLVDSEVRGGIYPGQYAFEASENVNIMGGVFPGKKALYQSKNVRSLESIFTGRDALDRARGVKCYSDRIEHLKIPASGVVVVRILLDYQLGGKAKVYAAELGPAAQRKHLKDQKIKLIDETYFNRTVTLGNLEEALADVKNYVLPAVKIK